MSKGFWLSMVEWSVGVNSQDRNNLILPGTSSQDCGPNDEHILDGITSLHNASVEGSLELVRL
jgi:hypothetical protein